MERVEKAVQRYIVGDAACIWRQAAVKSTELRSMSVEREIEQKYPPTLNDFSVDGLKMGVKYRGYFTLNEDWQQQSCE